MRYGQIVIGPAGSGKSTYCSNVVKYCQESKRTVHVVNLDPAAENFTYDPVVDIRDLVQVEDVMEDEELKLGPNGGLIFCLEYLIQNLDWLEQQLGQYDDDYILFDCPGQIELYTHIPLVKRLVDRLQQWNFRLCSVFLLDSQFVVSTSKYVAGVMTALSSMVSLELAHVNLLTKMDLLDKKSRKEVDEKYLTPDPTILLSDLSETTSKRYNKLNSAIVTLISDYSLVQFLPLNMAEEDALSDVMLYIDNTIQYGEDLDVKIPKLEADEDS
jgi:GTPase SAR1 family protein